MLIIASETRYGYSYFILVIDDMVSFQAEIAHHLDNFHASGDSEHIEAEMFFKEHEYVQLFYFDSEVEFQKKFIELSRGLSR